MPFAQLEHGVWQILATPFHGADMGVDQPSLRRIVEHAQAAGVAGVVALGVLGEAARLDSAERAAVLRTVVEAAGGLPVVAGVSALSTASAVEQAVTQRTAARAR